MPLASRFLFLLITGLLLVAGCNDQDDRGPNASPKEFWGAISSSPALVSLRFEDRQRGQQIISICVTDGFPGGVSEFFRGPISKGAFSLGSTSGNAQIDGTTIEGPRLHGSLRLDDGRLRNFEVKPMTNGGGRYDVTIGADGRWSGKGPDGNTLEARQEGNFVTGAISKERAAILIAAPPQPNRPNSQAFQPVIATPSPAASS